MSVSNPAVVLGLNPNGLGIVRSLYGVGIPVVGVDRTPMGTADTHRWMSSRTILCEKRFYDPQRSERLYDTLIDLGRSLVAPGVLFPSGDEELLCISNHREALAEYYRFCLPPIELVELLANKSRFYEYARENDIAIPRTLIKSSRDAVERAASELSFPCLIKPNMRDEKWNRSFAGNKVLTANDTAGLLELYDRVSARFSDFLIQEVIPGSDSELFFSHIYLSASLEPLAIWTGRKLRQRPIHFGTSTLTEAIWIDEIAEATVSILQALGCKGYSSIEFKRDPRDGRYKIMEITAGRTWYPHFLGFGAGVNIPHVWYRDLLGVAQTKSPMPEEGVRWVDEYRDLLASYDYWRVGELSFIDWLRSFRGKIVFAYASLRDPMPIIFVLLQIVIAIPRKARKVLRRRFGRAKAPK